MIAFARKLNLSLFTTMSRVFEVIEVKERIQKNVKAFKLLLDKYIGLKHKLSIGELTAALVDELGILKVYKEEGTQEAMARYDNIQELIGAVQEYSKSNPNSSLDDFLSEVSLIAGVDQYDEKVNSVTLMTIHSAKGLEFPIVFITGCEEDIFPLSQKFDQESKLEEERRLFYVALTRAKEKVFLSYARSRYRFGEVAYQSKSRFLDELDEKTFEEFNGTANKKAGRKKKTYYDEYYQESYDDYDQDRRSLRVGSRVTHTVFGMGKILQITGTGDPQRVTISFENHGSKQLLSKFANLKLI
jgi:DNA helicase-2/ATP-dependent DNA helicase PcrA